MRYNDLMMNDDMNDDKNKDSTRVLANGAILDTNKGRIVGNMPRDSEYYRAMARERWRRYREATEEGITQATRRASSVDAWSRLSASMAKIALGDDKNAVLAYQALHKALGLHREEGDNPSVTVKVDRIDARLSQVILRKLSDVT
jgi:hypothetical protein